MKNSTFIFILLMLNNSLHCPASSLGDAQASSSFPQDSTSSCKEEPSTLAQYEKYMAFIKETNPAVYHDLQNCAQALDKPCLVITQDPTSKILPPTHESKGYPLILLEQEPAIPEGEEHIKYILEKRLLPQYQKMADQIYEEPTNAGFYYLSLAHDLNLPFYPVLQDCSPTCFQRAAIHYSGPEIVPSTPCPTLVIPAGKPWFYVTKEDLSNPFAQWYEIYKQTSPQYVSVEECAHILELIKSYAPELYSEIVTVDPEGIFHINRHTDETGSSIFPFSDDGLPLIKIGCKWKNMPIEWQEFIMKHEIAHYVLGHFKNPTSHHSTLNPIKKVTTSLSPEEKLPFATLLAKAATRIREYEADRFAVLVLKADITQGIKWLEAERKQEGISKHPEKDTFKSTHPHYTARIKHLRNLRKEVDLQKARGENLDPIDWKALIRFYKGKDSQQLRDAL